ncbi:MAG: U32 family peptidase [Sterolibacteriaceae bacterium MAG5]|nr:U32 family peptidase [Candidatus Nitricoxidireducens bremensis]
MKAGVPIELLAPAKNLEFGLAAIDHGADAVYIGGPSFGARASAGNPVEDIERLAAHAHRYRAKVLVALNTILRDDELENARRVAWQAWEAGADALIVQDMGLLELDLPPIQLHASTQCDIRTPEKARFLEQAGFSQIVLARELDLAQIREIAAATSATLEFFIHGALCVSYSGQCYISHAHTGRSANRGECSQACRLPYTLTDGDGQVVVQDKHLLSMKDNNQTDNLPALIEAGIRSFKIEGRLKDLSYVKNVTAWYRRRLDALMAELPGFRPASSGRCRYTFDPQPDKTFNRGATDYFVGGRQQDIAAFDTPKFAGEPIGRVGAVGHHWFDIDGDAPLHNGDGLSFFDDHEELVGLRINRAEGRRAFVTALPPELAVGTRLYRNRDQEFERLLEKKSAERRIGLRLVFGETPAGFRLGLTDEDGVSAGADLPLAKEPAQHAERALAAIRENLGKLGNTLYAADDIALEIAQPWFIPASALNGLRREAVEKLDAARLAAYRRPARAVPVEPPPAFPQGDLSYLGNVYNQKAREFYTRHGVRLIDDAYECNNEKGLVSLMITKHCLRYSFNLCPKQVKGIRPDPMVLMNGGEKLDLRFDCKRCEMHVVGKLKKGSRIPLMPVPATAAGKVR